MYHLYLMKLHKYLERLNDSSPAVLRNLKMLSRMKWNICGLLLVLSVSFCLSKVVKPCEKKPNNPVCTIAGMTPKPQNQAGNGQYGKDNVDIEIDMFILGTDGFMGYMKTGKCINGIWNTKEIPSTYLCNSSVQSVKTDLRMTVFSFEENCTGSCTDCTKNTCITNNTDYGVILSRVQPYNLSISRFVIPAFVCLIEGRCQNDTLTDWMKRGCNWTNQSTQHFVDIRCNMTCLDPTKICQKAVYDPSCSNDNAGDESKINNIMIHNNTATCYKCGSAVKAVEQLPLPAGISNQFATNKTETDAGAAAGAMKNLSSLMSLMGNLTVASISMGNVKGILQKIQNESEITKSYIYSPNAGIGILEDLSQLKNYPNAFSIPEEAAKKALNQSAGSAFLGVFRFPNMTKDAENSTVLNDEVYAIEMGTRISNLSDPISLTFKYSNQQAEIPVCKSWDGNGKQPNWTTEGCNTSKQGNNILCTCVHLTFFAVLMSPPDIKISQNDLTALTYITYIGCGLSMFFLAIGLFMHFLLRKVKATDSMHVLINLFVALFLLNVAFLSNEYVARAKEITACKVMAGFMHYCLLASFTWFAVEAFHLCLQMSKHSVTIKHYLLKISVVGWAPPAVVVSLIFVLNEYGEQTIITDTSNVTMCWILDSNIHYYVNIGYYCLIFIFTFSTFVVVLRWLSMLKLSRLSLIGKVKRLGTANWDITTILGLCCMLGLTWSFAFFSYGAMRLPSYYIFTILNSFQGFFLFIYYLKTSRLIGDPAPPDESCTTEDTVTENPYEDLPTDDVKKAI